MKHAPCLQAAPVSALGKKPRVGGSAWRWEGTSAQAPLLGHLPSPQSPTRPDFPKQRDCSCPFIAPFLHLGLTLRGILPVDPSASSSHRQPHPRPVSLPPVTIWSSLLPPALPKPQKSLSLSSACITQPGATRPAGGMSATHNFYKEYSLI